MLGECNCFNHFKSLKRRDFLKGFAATATSAAIAAPAYAQVLWGKMREGCDFYGSPLSNDDVYTFTSTPEALNEVRRIVTSVGLPPNFEVMAANVPNAAAAIRVVN